jgi:transposase InsO family protein
MTLHHVCGKCIEGKHQRTSFLKHRVAKVSKLLEIMHTDVCRFMKPTSCGGAWYIVTFIDDFSKTTHVYFLQAKGEVFDKFIAYKVLVENKTSTKIKNLWSNNRGEFVSKKIDGFFDECGIQRQTSALHTPQQNGYVEHVNRTIIECVRSMIFVQGFDLEFWVEMVNMTIYIKNRCPTKVFDS